jgi:hypothetical protein
MKHQLRVMSQQLEMLRGSHPGKFTCLRSPQVLSNAAERRSLERKTIFPPAPITLDTCESGIGEDRIEIFWSYKPIDERTAVVSPIASRHLDHLIQCYTKRTPESKRQTQQYRPLRRPALGFRLPSKYWKEMVYPIVARQSSGRDLGRGWQ